MSNKESHVLVVIIIQLIDVVVALKVAVVSVPTVNVSATAAVIMQSLLRRPPFL